MSGIHLKTCIIILIHIFINGGIINILFVVHSLINFTFVNLLKSNDSNVTKLYTQYKESNGLRKKKRKICKIEFYT